MSELTISPARRTVDTLHALGHQPPTALDEALRVHAEATAYQGPELIDLDLEALTVKPGKVAKLLDAAADGRAQRDAIATVRTQLVDRLQRRVLRTLTACADEITTTLEPTFTAAAETFTTAYRQLPHGWQDAATLLRAGAAAVANLEDAQAAAATLDACRTIRKALPQPLHKRGPATLYCRVTDTLAADELGKIPENGPLGYFGNLIEQPGVEALAWWPTTAAHRAYLDTLPARSMSWVKANENGLVGLKQVVS